MFSDVAEMLKVFFSQSAFKVNREKKNPQGKPCQYKFIKILN